MQQELNELLDLYGLNEPALKVFCVVGTRPEFIKMLPVYLELKKLSETMERELEVKLEVKWISSSQHVELVEDLYELFGIKADHSFDIKEPEVFVFDDKSAPSAKKKAISDGAKLSSMGAKILKAASDLFEEETPDLVYVQGDTMTVQQVAQAAFYHRIPLAHIEAGLRTDNLYSPFPEELARRTLGQIANLHFAPTEKAYNAVKLEIDTFRNDETNKLFLVGNTVVDALRLTEEMISRKDFDWSRAAIVKKAHVNESLSFNGAESYNLLDKVGVLKQSAKKVILVTAHRRENFEFTHKNLAIAIEKFLAENDDYHFICSLHKNPESREAFAALEKLENKVTLCEAISYPMFLKLMLESHLIMTDSGGIQEEAPYLKKPVLVFRESTERMESIEAGVVKLVGTSEESIYEALTNTLSDTSAYDSMICEDFDAYGDGKAAQKIVSISLEEIFETSFPLGKEEMALESLLEN